jgi:hypothetical protein
MHLLIGSLAVLTLSLTRMSTYLDRMGSGRATFSAKVREAS